MIKIKLFDTRVTTFIILLVLFRPFFILRFPILDIIFNVLRVVITVVLIIIHIKRIRYEKYIIYVTVFWLYYNGVCLGNNTWDFSVLIETVLSVCTVLMVNIYFDGHIKTLYIALEKLLLFYGTANFITILLGFPVNDLFLGLDNDAAMSIIIMLGVLLYLSIVINGKINNMDYFIFVLHMVQYFITWSVAAVVTFVMFLYFINVKRIKFTFFTSRNSVLYSVLLWCGLHIFKLQNIVGWFFEFILRRDLTISYRIYIWQAALNAISVKWMFGYGNYIKSSEYHRMTKMVLPYGIINSPHNLWLYICLCGGLVWQCFLILLIIKGYKSIDQGYTEKSNKILLLTLFCYLLCGTVASLYSIEYLFFLLAVSSFSKKLNTVRNEDVILKSI